MDPRILVIVDILLALAQRQAAFASILRAMRAENRTSLNDAEWKAVLDADDSADARLEAEIAKARAEGR